MIVLPLSSDNSCSLNAFKGLLQFSQHLENQEIYFLLSDLGIYTPTRLMQGATDSANEFQPGILEVLGNVIYTCMLIWIDDLFVYAKDFKEVLQVLDKIFERLEKFNVKLTLVRSKDQQGWRQI
jgi:hypothetical protein